EVRLAFDYCRETGKAGTLIDVGAHTGESFAPFLRLGWRVVAFEPDPENRRVIAEKGLDRGITLLPHAVSDREEDDVPFYSSSESSGISSLSAFRPSHREVARVKVVTLQRIASEQNIFTVDFLKIDTEGHDYFVLKGFPWEKMHAEIVVCEFEDSKTEPLGYTYRDLGGYLMERRYTVFLSEWYPVVRFGGNHHSRSFKRYPVILTDPRGWGNFVAARSAEAAGYS